MATTRVWNITDDANPDVKPQNLRVMGKLVTPGRFITVDEKDLKQAHKVHADVGRGYLFIGKVAPSSYAKARKPARAKLADGVARQGLASNRPAKKVLELKDEVKVEDPVAVEAAPVEMEAPAPDPFTEAEPEETSSGSRGRKKKGK